MKEAFPIDLLPRVVEDYVSVCRTVTEAPDEFLVAGALFALSVLTGSSTEFNGQALNGYYLIVGPTGTAKKTTAQDLGCELLRRVKNQFNDRVRKDVLTPSGSVTVADAFPVVTHFSVEGLQTGALGDGTSLGIQMGE